MTAFVLVLVSKNPKGGFTYQPSGCDEGATLGNAVPKPPNPESGYTILQHPLSAHHDLRSEEQPWGIKLVAGLGSQSTINFQLSTPSSTIN